MVIIQIVRMGTSFIALLPNRINPFITVLLGVFVSETRLNSKYFFVLAALLLVFAAPALAVLEQGSLKIFAITDDGQGLSADLKLFVESGTGKIWSSVTPLVGTSTQNAEKTAINLAKNYSTRVNEYDYHFEISSSASIVDGPSAGAATALLAISVLTDRPLPKNIGLTGTISQDGGVGPVGGIFEKAREASKIGIDLFMIPRGEAKQVVRIDNKVESINLVEYAPKNWNMKVVEVDGIDDVIQFAFSDIEQIDVNEQIEQTLVDFIPAPIAYHPLIAPLQSITQKYLNKSRDLVKDAKNALNTTMLTDQSLIEIMLDSMNESERVLERAESLFDQNFLYSSANFSFLAKINAAIVRDIAENPSILSESSVVFHSKLTALQDELARIKPSIDSSLVSENIDWQISAQQRFSWAENNVDKLLNTQTIVIGEGQTADPYSSQLSRLREFEFATAWKDVSNDLAKDLGRGRKADKDRSAINAFIEQHLISAENNLTNLDGAQAEDILRRFESAQKEQANNWFLAAATDSAAASYLAQAELLIENKNVSDLKPVLEDKVQALDNALAQNPRSFVWTRIYLDHARYFLQGVNYYLDQNQNSAALSMAQSGISVVYLAESSFESSKEIYAYYDTLDPRLFEFAEVPQTNSPNNSDSSNGLFGNSSNFLLALLILIVIVSWLLIVFLYQKSKASKPAKEHPAMQALVPSMTSLPVPSNEPLKEQTQMENFAPETESQPQAAASPDHVDAQTQIAALENELARLRRQYEKSKPAGLKTNSASSNTATRKTPRRLIRKKNSGQDKK